MGIEDNTFPNIRNISLKDLAPGFVSKFIESHKTMLQGNSNLKPKEGEWTSKPWEWPFLYKGQWFSAGEEHRVYLLGTPVIWWGNLVLWQPSYVPCSGTILNYREDTRNLK